MAWDDERRMRAERARERGGDRPPGDTPTEPIGAPSRGERLRGAGTRAWDLGSRAGWAVALALAIVAIALGGVALARSGGDDGDPDRDGDRRGAAIERSGDRGGEGPYGHGGGRGRG